MIDICDLRCAQHEQYGRSCGHHDVWDQNCSRLMPQHDHKSGNHNQYQNREGEDKTKIGIDDDREELAKVRPVPQDIAGQGCDRPTLIE